MPTQLTSAYQEALALASELHGTQTRKGTEIPYIAHLLAVSAIVLEHGGSEDEAIAALLHDAIEDAGGDATRARIADQFGEPVAQIIDGCSDDNPAPGQKKRPWRERKDAYIAHLAEASPSVLLVSAADKLHNALSIDWDYNALGEALWSRFNAPRDDILWYYRALIEAMDAREAALQEADPDHLERHAGLGRLLDKLELVIEELHLDVEIEESAALFAQDLGVLDVDEGLYSDEEHLLGPPR